MNQAAKERALRILDRRDVSRQMLIDKLTEKEIPEEDAREVADWLCELGVVNDERFAGLVVRHYAAKGYGRRRIEQELYFRGIDRELWDSAMEELPEADDTIDRFLRSRVKDPNDPDELRHYHRLLLRRGYSWEEVSDAMERFREEFCHD